MLESQLEERKSSDLLSVFLIDKLHLNPVALGLISAIFSSLLFFISGLVSGTLITGLGKVGLLDDWLHWVFAIIINPSIFGYYLWSSSSIKEIIDNLEKSDLIKTNCAEIKSTLSIYKERKRIYISLFTATLYSIYFFISRNNLSGWTSSGLIPQMSGTLLSLFAGFAASMAVSNLLLNIIILNRIFLRKKLSINLLHPDKCGGFAFLGKYSLRTAYLISVFGAWLFIAVYDFQISRFNHIYFLLFFLLPFYIVLSLLTFLSPLFSAHIGMKKLKSENLEMISIKYQELYEVTKSSINLELSELEEKINKLEEIKKLYEIAKKIPIWPFDMPIISRYFISTLGVCLPFLFELLNSRI